LKKVADAFDVTVDDLRSGDRVRYLWNTELIKEIRQKYGDEVAKYMLAQPSTLPAEDVIDAPEEPQ